MEHYLLNHLDEGLENIQNLSDMDLVAAHFPEHRGGGLDVPEDTPPQALNE